MDMVGDVLASLGTSIINFLVDALLLIVEFFLVIITFFLDLIINTFSFMFSDGFMGKVYGALPVISQADSTLTAIGIGIAAMLLAAMIYHMMVAPLLSGGKNAVYPSMVVFRTLFVFPLVFCAEAISIWLSNLFTEFYSVMTTAFWDQLGNYRGGNPFYLTTAAAKFLAGDFANWLDPNEANETVISGATGLPEAVMDTISSAVGMILVLILVILVGWNLIQLFLEMFERFAVMFFIMKISPLTLATAINPSSENIAKSWVKFFFGQFSLWVLQVMCMGWVIGCLGPTSLELFSNEFPGVEGLLAWAGISYGLINMSRHVDDYINKLGLTAAISGSDFFGDVGTLMGLVNTARKAIGGKDDKKSSGKPDSANTTDSMGTEKSTFTKDSAQGSSDSKEKGGIRQKLSSGAKSIANAAEAIKENPKEAISEIGKDGIRAVAKHAPAIGGVIGGALGNGAGAIVGGVAGTVAKNFVDKKIGLSKTGATQSAQQGASQQGSHNKPETSAPLAREKPDTVKWGGQSFTKNTAGEINDDATYYKARFDVNNECASMDKVAEPRRSEAKSYYTRDDDITSSMIPKRRPVTSDEQHSEMPKPAKPEPQLPGGRFDTASNTKPPQNGNKPH